jgi:plastocyanin
MSATTPATSRRMGRTRAIVGVIFIIVVVLVSLYLLTQPHSRVSTPTPTVTNIQIASGTGASGTQNFSPPSLKVKIGFNNTVAWTNSDNTDHSVTFTSAPSGVSVASLTDPGLNAGETFVRTLTVPGTYQYHCTFHTWMTATITVVS